MMNIFWEIALGILIVVYVLIARMEWRLRKLKGTEEHIENKEEQQTKLRQNEMLNTTELMETLEEEMQQNPFSESFTRSDDVVESHTTKRPFKVLKNKSEL